MHSLPVIQLKQTAAANLVNADSLKVNEIQVIVPE